MLKLIILDIDGVLTDGCKYYDKNGIVQLKTFCDKDWTAIKRFKTLNIPVIFLTGDTFNTEIAKKRNIEIFVNRDNGSHVDKVKYLPILCSKYNVTTDNILYIGDDIFDVQLLNAVKFKFCPADAVSEVKKVAHTLKNKGGNNVIAELFEYLELAGSLPKYEFHEHLTKVYEIDIKEKF